MGRKRNTQLAIITEKRKQETAAMILAFKPRMEIVEYLCQTYNIKPRSCDHIITQAYEFIRDNYPVDRESIIITHLNYYYEIARDWKHVDPKAALKALEQIEKLLKLHQDVPLIQNNTLSLNLESVTDEQLMKAIESINKDKNNA